jgi:formamidopyrimidine-DNA glycosylase
MRMPELPEVETVRRTLMPHLKGRTIRSAEFRQVRVLRGDADEMARRLAGRKILSLERRGKFIMMHLSDGGGVFTVHLGMTGNLAVAGEVGKHTHAVLQLDRGVLTYTDPRMFGRLEWSKGIPASVAKLGPEPLTVEFEEFFRGLHKRKTNLKALLLDQKFLGGVGNIYADEALFRAGIHPLTRASSLTKLRAQRLYEAVREILADAIAHRGSTVVNYVDSEGRRGEYQESLKVYQRHGEPCVKCGRPIQRTLVAQRGTHFCPNCQKRR